MINVVGDDGAAAGDLTADELGSDHLRDGRTETFARMLAAQLLAQTIESLVFADRDKFHFGRDDAAPGIVHLADIHS